MPPVEIRTTLIQPENIRQARYWPLSGDRYFVIEPRNPTVENIDLLITTCRECPLTTIMMYAQGVNALATCRPVTNHHQPNACLSNRGGKIWTEQERQIIAAQSKCGISPDDLARNNIKGPDEFERPKKIIPQYNIGDVIAYSLVSSADAQAEKQTGKGTLETWKTKLTNEILSVPAQIRSQLCDYINALVDCIENGTINPTAYVNGIREYLNKTPIDINPGINASHEEIIKKAQSTGTMSDLLASLYVAYFFLQETGYSLNLVMRNLLDKIEEYPKS